MSDPFIDYISQFVTEHKRALFETVLEQRTRHFTVVLEDIFQSQNASACLRTCDCFGIQDVHVIENVNVLSINRLVVRGATQWLTIHRHGDRRYNTAACIESLRQDGYRVIATSSNADDATLLPDYDVSQKTALMFGTEEDGLSQEAKELADGFLKVPMFGFTDCFNISVALALCLQNLTMRLRRSSVPWRLSDDECDELRAEWIKQVLQDRLPTLQREFRRRSGRSLSRR